MEKKYLSVVFFLASVFALSGGGVFAQSSCPPPRESAEVCIQLVSWAKNPQTGNCCEYGTPCGAPQGWLIYYSESECKNTQLNHCRAVGQFCGGIAPGAFQCCGGLVCKLDGNYPDAGGTCVADDKCGNGICETQEEGYCFERCVDFPQGGDNCASRCVPSTCPRDCVSGGNGGGATSGNPNAAAIERQIAAIRVRLISLIQQLIEMLTLKLPK